MPYPGQSTVSQTARLMLGGPEYHVGWQLPVYPLSPAATAEWSYTVDGRYAEILVAVRYVFTASAVVSNRFIEVRLTDANGTVITQVPGGFGISAGQVTTVNLVNNGPAYDTGGQGSGFGFLPAVLIPPGWSWSSVTVGLSAGDQFSAIALLVHRFPSDTLEIDSAG